MAEILIKIKTADSKARNDGSIRWKMTIAILGLLAALVTLVAAYVRYSI